MKSIFKRKKLFNSFKNFWLDFFKTYFIFKYPLEVLNFMQMYLEWSSLKKMTNFLQHFNSSYS